MPPDPIPGEPDVLPPETGDDHVPHDGTADSLRRQLASRSAELEIMRVERDAAMAMLSRYGIATRVPVHVC